MHLKHFELFRLKGQMGVLSEGIQVKGSLTRNAFLCVK